MKIKLLVLFALSVMVIASHSNYQTVQSIFDKIKEKKFIQPPNDFYPKDFQNSDPLYQQTSQTSNQNDIQTNYYFDVTDYGAAGDEITDNTQPFAAAMQDASSVGGGVVIIPPGKYIFNGNLNVPNSVCLKGSYNTVPSHPDFATLDQYEGTVLLPLANRGLADGTPFITLNENSELTGVVIYYINQPQNPQGNPTPYPWTVSMIRNNAAIFDCELVNPYQAISAVQAHRHYIARIQGQPIYRGLFIDFTADIGRIENVHWNPWWSNNLNVTNFQLSQGIAFTFGRSDWEYVFNTFAFGYSIGYYFIQTSSGMLNGNFLGIGADLMTKAAVQVDASQPYGILITNGEFTAFVDKNWCTICDSFQSTHVITNSTNSGPIKFVNTAFWGPAHKIALLQGSSSVQFSSCNFDSWDVDNKKEYAITASNGQVMIMGNQFHKDAPQVELLKGTDKAIIIGNMITGTLRISNDKSVKIQEVGNVSD